MTHEPQALVIYPDRRQMLWVAGGVLLGFLAGLLGVLAPQWMTRGFRPVYVLLSWFVAPLCGWILFYLISRLLRQRPALVVDRHGVWDHTSPFSAGLIPWADIAEVVVGRQLGFILHDQRAFLTRQTFPRRLILSLLMRVNREAHISLPPALLPLPSATLARHIADYYDQYVRQDQ
jgi:hypothetical protein